MLNDHIRRQFKKFLRRTSFQKTKWKTFHTTTAQTWTSPSPTSNALAGPWSLLPNATGSQPSDEHITSTKVSRRRTKEKQGNNKCVMKDSGQREAETAAKGRTKRPVDSLGGWLRAASLSCLTCQEEEHHQFQQIGRDKSRRWVL